MSIPSFTAIFSFNFLTFFQKKNYHKLQCLSSFPFFELLLEWNGDVTSRFDLSQCCLPQQSSASISSFSEVYAPHQCSAPLQAPTMRLKTIPAPFDLILAPFELGIDAFSSVYMYPNKDHFSPTRQQRDNSARE